MCRCRVDPRPKAIAPRTLAVAGGPGQWQPSGRRRQCRRPSYFKLLLLHRCQLSYFQGMGRHAASAAYATFIAAHPAAGLHALVRNRRSPHFRLQRACAQPAFSWTRAGWPEVAAEWLVAMDPEEAVANFVAITGADEVCAACCHLCLACALGHALIMGKGTHPPVALPLPPAACMSSLKFCGWRACGMCGMSHPPFGQAVGCGSTALLVLELQAAALAMLEATGYNLEAAVNLHFASGGCCAAQSACNSWLCARKPGCGRWQMRLQ